MSLFYADLHIHSKYSRATSKNCDLENLYYWGRKKGITVIGTGDFTHPVWFSELKEKLVPDQPGLFRLKPELEKEIDARLPKACQGLTRFMLSVEVSTIYKKGDKTRKVHHLIYAPDFEKAGRIRHALDRIGNINSDGRPILGLDSRHLLEITLQAGEGCYLVPAHIWTPWFSVLGSKSGFDCVDDCYGDLASHIFAVETGLSSDPEMIRQVSSLDKYRLVSNSDAHSPAKLGREVNVFSCDVDYFAIAAALQTGQGFWGTVEFFPEEGKYHLDGHRKCGVCLTPQESKANHGLCPVCKKPLTLGVAYRINELSDRSAETSPVTLDQFKSLIPLPEIIAETLQVGPNSKRVAYNYDSLLAKLGDELTLMSQVPIEDIQKSTSSLLAEAIKRMRQGQVIRKPGYDGEYGVIRLFEDQELKGPVMKGLFNEEKPEAKSIQQQPMTQKREPLTPSPKNKQPTIEERNIFALDDTQRQALEIITGPLLVMAGPGSGKTRTLTHRIAHLIAHHNVAPSHCLTITFTKKAAEEMRDRLKKLLPARVSEIPVHTFHSFCLDFLMENRELAGLPRGFRVASEIERRDLLMEIFGYSYAKAQKILNAISILKRQSGKPTENKTLKDNWDQIEEEYFIRGWLDYDDLIVKTNDLFASDERIKEHYRNRYPYLSIDEYQDIDALQYQLIRSLSSETSNICAIGDPDQSIYAFRGAEVGYFLKFKKDFKEVRTLSLTTNYRSNATILNASRQMISPTTLSAGESFEAVDFDKRLVTIQTLPTDKSEAEFVVKEIEKLLGGSSFFAIDSSRSDGESSEALSFSDIAVLYRTQEVGQALKEAFDRSGLPYQQNSHQSLYDQQAVQKVLGFMEEVSPESLTKKMDQAVDLWMQEMKPHLDAKGIEQEFPLSLREGLAQLARRYEGRWDDFTNSVRLGSVIDLWDPLAERVSLMTLHASKGLEFKVVFIVGCEQNIIPLSFQGKISAEEKKEERRLFYVGMTRAKKHLVLSHALKRRVKGKLKDQKVSCFISDIRQELLDKKVSQPKQTKNTDAKKQMSLF